MIDYRFLLLSVMSRAASSHELAVPARGAAPPALPAHAARQLVATQATKSSLTKSLMALLKAGMLTADADVTERGIKRELEQAGAFHSRQDTRYGPIVQTMDLDAPRLQK